MIRRGRKEEPAGLCLFPKGDKYGHSDSIIRSLRIVCEAYAIRPYTGGCAPRPHLLCLSPIGAICGAYAIRPYKRGCAPRPLPPHLSPVGAICGAYAIRPYVGGCAPTPPTGAACALRPLTVLCDPLYKCAGRLWVLMGWGRSVTGRVWGLNGLHIIY